MPEFKGCPYPIRMHPRGLLHVEKGVNQIKADLLILLLTNPGERCLAGETLIPLADGTKCRIVDLVGRKAFWVYSFDSDANRIVAGRATASKTGENVEVFRVTLDNNEEVVATGNHLWLLRDGNYMETSRLVEKQSLMPLYANINTSGYQRIYQPNIDKYRETHLCFVEETRLEGVREVVHHKNLNKRNNDPENLQWMTCVDHIELHKKITNIFCLKMENDPVFREAFCLKVSKGLKKYYETHDGNRKGVELTEDQKRHLSELKTVLYSSPAGDEVKNKISRSLESYFADHAHPWVGRTHSEATKEKMRGPRSCVAGEKNPSKRPEVRQKTKESWERRRAKNHKVKSVEKLSNKQDCYDLHVENYHNFAVSAGVFVHNCMLPRFGTPLRRLLFEPNDATLKEQAREMIIDSIKKWEPRITVQAIDVQDNWDELDPDDPREEVEHILGIRIRFVDPGNIAEVQELTLEMPLGGN